METGQGLTSAPLTASDGAPEFCDTDGLRSMFGIKRSLAYELLNAGEIRGVSLRREGRSRGKRLFDVASVCEYLHSCSGFEAYRIKETRR
jgi:hypothetical protein